MGEGPPLEPSIVHEVGFVSALAPRPILIVGAPRSGTTWVGRVLGLTEGVFYVHEPDNEGLDPRALRAKRNVGRFPVLSGNDEAPEYLALWREVLDCGPPDSRSYRWRAARKLLRGAKQRGELEGAFRRASREDSLRLKMAGLFAVHGAPLHTSARPVVKSIYAPLAAGWIDDHLHPIVLAVFREPLNTMSSAKTRFAPRAELPDHPRVAEWIRTGRIPAPPPNLSPIGRATWHLGVLRWGFRPRSVTVGGFR